MSRSSVDDEPPATTSPPTQRGSDSRHRPVLAQIIRIRGIVQGVGFRPFVFRLARAHGLVGWVSNDSTGVCIHAEGNETSLEAFSRDLRDLAPPAARIDCIDAAFTETSEPDAFRIADSLEGDAATAGISPDLAACGDCVTELFDSANPRFEYAYVNCTACGPRYSIMHELPYDRSATTMAAWTMCEACQRDYEDPTNRRFHAQPVACARCGPRYMLDDGSDAPALEGTAAIRAAVAMLAVGKIVAIKGIGGYHLACDAANSRAIDELRGRKFRKEQPFALMVRDIETARSTIELSPESEMLLNSVARPILVAPSLVPLAGVAPGMRELGVMLPYTPLHHLLFAYGAPARLVMTSANRSSEPIAYRDDDAFDRLAGIADAFLTGERQIARRVDDSVVRIGAAGAMMLRRSRGYAPAGVAEFPSSRTILALGADLKNTVTLVVSGNAIVSQHIGDLSNYGALEAFRETVADLMEMHDVRPEDLAVVHDLHPQYSSTAFALDATCAARRAVQHHRAHVASVLAERGAFEERVIGVALDGTGYGDDGAIWGGEFFFGSVIEGFERVGHLRPARLPGGDAASRYPVQSAAGFLADSEIDVVRDLMTAPFHFPARYAQARELLTRDVRCFPTSSTGRLFDAAAALLGFTGEVTYEGQAAIWLENLAFPGSATTGYPFPFSNHQLDYREALTAMIEARGRGDSPGSIASAFHRGLARGIADGIALLAEENGTRTAVLSGGVFQNDLLLAQVIDCLSASSIRVWTNRAVPPNDGGISLGQAALMLGIGGLAA